MRFLAALGVLCFLAITSASAQVQVSAQTKRTNFLLFERVDLLVTVTNVGENDLVLDNQEGRPWLSFLVSGHNRLPIHSERKATFKELSLKAGESKTLDINITPLFSFREEGDYSAEAIVDLPGQGQMMSDPVPFTVLHGKQVWTETRPVNGVQYTYSLLRFAPNSSSMKLYLRVVDPVDNIVLTNLALGDLAAYIDPEVFFDPQGNLHIMQPISDGTYLYSRAGADGKIQHQGLFRTYQTVPPRLTKMADGNVIVLGGLEENPNQPRDILSNGQRSAQNTTPTTGADPTAHDTTPMPLATPAPPVVAPNQGP